MKTYEDNGYRYWYDTHVRMWTIYRIDIKGNQVGEAQYHGNRERLKANVPMLEFKSVKL